MAERKKSKNKEIKIIREFVNVPFKEIEKEKEVEESLEEEIEEEKEESFEFPELLTEAITPILQPSSETQTLERELEKTPAFAAATAETAEQEYTSVYNMPEYSYEKEAAPERKVMQQTGMLIRQDEIREIKPRAEIEEWHELKGAGQQTRERLAVVETEILDREMKLPFEEKRKYRKIRG